MAWKQLKNFSLALISTSLVGFLEAEEEGKVEAFKRDLEG